MKNPIEVKIDAAFFCHDCALYECCPCSKKHVPYLGFDDFANGSGVVTAWCHVKKGGKQ